MMRQSHKLDFLTCGNKAHPRLVERPDVTSHPQFKYLLRKAAEELLEYADEGEFIVRPASDANKNSLAITLVMNLKVTNHSTRNRKGNKIVHCILDANHASNDIFINSPNLIEQFKDFITSTLANRELRDDPEFSYGKMLTVYTNKIMAERELAAVQALGKLRI